MLPTEWPDPPQIPGPMRVVCMSDLHNEWTGGTLQAKDINALKGNLLLIAGDIVSGTGNVAQYKSFAAWLGHLNFERIIAIPGNHDVLMEVDFDKSAGLFSHDPRVTFLDQETVEYRGLKIYGEPRQPAFYNWAYNVPRDRMKRVWDKVPKDTDILLTHGPPLGAGDLTLRGPRVGCEYQREWILKNEPRLVVHGHIHYSAGLYQLGKTTVINAACVDENRNPTQSPIVINLCLP